MISQETVFKKEEKRHLVKVDRLKGFIANGNYSYEIYLNNILVATDISSHLIASVSAKNMLTACLNPFDA